MRTSNKLYDPRHPAPPPAPYRPERWHHCAHPVCHGVAVAALLVGWLSAALVYGLPWAMLLSRHVGPGLNLLMACVFGALWLCMVMPYGVIILFVLGMGACRPDASSRAPVPAAVPGRRTTERIILSPEAAAQRFGIRGTIILERDREE